MSMPAWRLPRLTPATTLAAWQPSLHDSIGTAYRRKPQAWTPWREPPSGETCCGVHSMGVVVLQKAESQSLLCSLRHPCPQAIPDMEMHQPSRKAAKRQIALQEACSRPYASHCGQDPSGREHPLPIPFEASSFRLAGTSSSSAVQALSSLPKRNCRPQTPPQASLLVTRR